MVSLFWHELRSRRGAIIGWGIGLALFALMYISFYPQVGEQFASMPIGEIDFYKAFGIEDFSTLASYMAATYVNFLPILLGIYALATGTSALAGEEDSCTLELVAAAPVTRSQIVLGKALAMSVAALLILVIAGVGAVLSFMYIQGQVETDLTAASMMVVSLSALPITLFYMMLSLWLGAYLPTRRAAAMVATLLLVIGYLGNNLLGLVPSLEGLRVVLPFHYFDASSKAFQGVALGDVAVLLVAAAVFLGLALLSFQRRNLTVGAWPWARPRPA